MGDAALNGFVLGVLGVLGTALGGAYNGAANSLSRAAYERLPLSTKLLLESNAIHGLSNSSSARITGSTIGANIISTGISNSPINLGGPNK